MKGVICIPESVLHQRRIYDTYAGCGALSDCGTLRAHAADACRCRRVAAAVMRAAGRSAPARPDGPGA